VYRFDIEIMTRVHYSRKVLTSPTTINSQQFAIRRGRVSCLSLT